MFIAFLELKQFEDGQILPVIWMEVVPGEISKELRAMIYHSTFSANAIQLSLRFGTLIAFVTSLALLVGAIFYRKRTVTKSLQESEIENHNKNTEISCSSRT